MLTKIAHRPFLSVLYVLVFLIIPKPASGGADASGRETDLLVLKKLEWFRDAKFGLLLHWGPYSQWGIVESWSICSEDEDWIPRRFPSYQEHCEKYEKLPTTFNPVKFDPARWALAARYAGMKYVVFTTKHHDGFCMFDTKQTSYKITDSTCPFHTNPRANVAREVFEAFRAKGFGVGAYFSKPDWHSPDYWAPEWAHPDRNVNYIIKRHPEKWQRFCSYTYNQIEELTTGYGPIDILWLDGGWVRPLTDEQIREVRVREGYSPRSIQSQDINMPRIAAMARRHQPGLIIVDRTVRGIYENYRTPEQEIPGNPPEYPWETCMTMATQWSFKPDDTYKPARTLIHLLVEIVSKGGNFILNVGPDAQGQLPDTALQRLKDMGDWLSVNGSGIYKTRPVSPYKDGKVRFTALPGRRINAIYLASDGEVAPPGEIYLKSIAPAAGSTVHMLGVAEPLQWKRTKSGIRVSIPQSVRERPPCRDAWTITFTRKQQKQAGIP